MAANSLFAMSSLQETLVRAGTLLKPGVSLLLLEQINSDALVGPFIFYGFPGRWRNEAEDPGRGAAVAWDKILRAAGFSDFYGPHPRARRDCCVIWASRRLRH